MPPAPEEEELEFKDVPIFSNFTRVASIPRNPAPGLRYVPVRTCNKDGSITPSANEEVKHEGMTSVQEQHDNMVNKVVENVMATVQQMTEEHKASEETVQVDEAEVPTEISEAAQSTDSPSTSDSSADGGSKPAEEVSDSLPSVDIDDTDSFTTEPVDDTPKDFTGYKVYRVTVPTEEVSFIHYLLCYLISCLTRCSNR